MFEQLVFALKTEFALKFLRTGGATAPPTPRLVRLCSCELKDSKTVFVQFTTADLPGEVKVGYLFFRVKQYVPRLLRCFKCNRYGHVAGHCRGKLRCSICGGEHKYSDCSAAVVLRR